MVPISLELGGDHTVMLITGPNAGGKTVALKTVGLLAMMAQAGLHVPADEARFPCFDGIYADIGDQQSIEHSLSTFSSHVGNLLAIMERSTADSLLLVDELGASTDPEEGSALAKAISAPLSAPGTADGGHHPPPQRRPLRPGTAGDDQRQRGTGPGDSGPDLPPGPWDCRGAAMP